MTNDKIFEAIVNILQKKLKMNISETISPESLLRDEGIESIQSMALIVYLEKEYNKNLDTIYEINYNDLTFDELINLIKEA